ncbi:hypothetical protein AB0C28_00045 [Nonomuraea sp. NPDC048892]|uniref:hypothetical protein n=1 Tax=Nonomuraea sp. NPDC048892 TaxID=3154624 RepID=UPI003400416D
MTHSRYVANDRRAIREVIEPSAQAGSAMTNAVDVLGFDPFDGEFLRDPYPRHRDLRAWTALFRTRV